MTTTIIIILLSTSFFCSAVTLYVILARAPFTIHSVPLESTLKDCPNEEFSDHDELEEKLVSSNADDSALRKIVREVEDQIIKATIDSPQGLRNKELQKRIAPLLCLRQRALDRLFIRTGSLDYERFEAVNEACLRLEKDNPEATCIPTKLATLPSYPIYGSDFSIIWRTLGQITEPNSDPAPCQQLMQEHFEGIEFSTTFQTLHGMFYYSMPDLAHIEGLVRSEEIKII